MKVGLGLPTAVAGAEPAAALEWAREADRGPFASVAVHDRLLYPSLEPLTALAAAAAVTRRVDLACLVAIAPLRPAALLAKQARTVDGLSGGRLVLGLGVGPREDDYQVAGADFSRRGRTFDAQLLELRRHWRDRALAPPAGTPRPRLLLGGLSDAALLRLARFGDGYVHNGGPARAFASAADRVLAAWSDAGRPGLPELWGMGYFALGDGAGAAGQRHLRDYYGFTGGYAGRIAAGLLTDARAVRDFAGEYAGAGCDHLVLFPATSGPEQVALLADALAG